MINKKFVAIVLAVGLFLSMGCVVSRQPGPQDAFGAQDVFGESDNSWQQEAGSTFSVAVDDINIGQAYSGNSEPVTILVRIVETPESPNIGITCNAFPLDNLLIDTITTPSGHAVDIKSHSWLYNSPPCSFEVLLAPTCDWSGGPVAQSPMDDVCPRYKWAKGDYLFRLRYSRDGSEYFSNDFGFTIGGKGVPDNLHRIDEAGSRRGLVP